MEDKREFFLARAQEAEARAAKLGEPEVQGTWKQIAAAWRHLADPFPDSKPGDGVRARPIGQQPQSESSPE
jgi:hypothetical protein